jgi:hypothetical protein
MILMKNEGGKIISLIVTIAILLALVTTVAVSYYKYILLQDFMIYAQVECNPESEECFIFQCSPDDDAECSFNEEEQFTYYKIIYKPAYDIPSCNTLNEECEELSCDTYESKCEVIYCSDETMSNYQDLDYCG